MLITILYTQVEPNLDAGNNAQYGISFLSDLTDGTYNIVVEDDAGNQNDIFLRTHLPLIVQRQFYQE